MSWKLQKTPLRRILLAAAPEELPATTLEDWCYEYMFYGCTSINLSETQTEDQTQAWSIPATANAAADWNKNMFYGTGGEFTGAPEIGTTYYMSVPTVPPYLASLAAWQMLVY